MFSSFPLEEKDPVVIQQVKISLIESVCGQEKYGEKMAEERG